MRRESGRGCLKKGPVARQGPDGDMGEICCLPTTLCPFGSSVLGRVEGHLRSGRCPVPLITGQESVLSWRENKVPGQGCPTVVRGTDRRSYADPWVFPELRNPDYLCGSAREGSKPGQTGSYFCKTGAQGSPGLPGAGPAARQWVRVCPACVFTEVKGRGE